MSGEASSHALPPGQSGLVFKRRNASPRPGILTAAGVIGDRHGAFCFPSLAVAASFILERITA
jgi:hypothetical protein